MIYNPLSGAFSEVRLAEDKLSPGTFCAIKCIRKRSSNKHNEDTKFSEDDFKSREDSLKNEISVLRRYEIVANSLFSGSNIQILYSSLMLSKMMIRITWWWSCEFYFMGGLVYLHQKIALYLKLRSQYIFVIMRGWNIQSSPKHFGFSSMLKMPFCKH